ncbi:MAG: wax ester/triacylglycerol synthase family O-acyltransferase, partial [Pseudomonadota bacterium]
IVGSGSTFVRPVASNRPLSGLDAAFLYLEGLGTPMHVGSLMLISPQDGTGKDFHLRLREHVADRLAAAAPLRRVLEDAPLGLSHPIWREHTELDMDWHIQRQKVRAPGSMAALRKLAARLHAEPMDRDKPLWQLVVIDGLKDGRIALYSRIHHALLDGQGGVALARALLDIEPDPKTPGHRVEPHAPSRPTGTIKLAAKAAGSTISSWGRWMRGIPETVKLAASSASSPVKTLSSLRESVMLAPRTPFNVQISDERALGLARLSLARLKSVAKAHEVSLNDVIMAVCTTALRRSLKRKGALPDKALIAGMPVSLRAEGDGESNNQVSMVQCELPTEEPDPIERLRRIHASTGRIKHRVQAFSELIPTDFPGLAAPFWATGLSRLWKQGRLSERLPPLANLVISNVPGPPVPLFLAGARVDEYYPLSIVTHGLGLNITVQSYAGTMEFGILSCPEALAGPDRLAKHLEIALDELEESGA